MNQKAALIAVGVIAVLVAVSVARTPQQDGLRVTTNSTRRPGQYYFDYNVTIVNPSGWTTKGNYSLMDILPKSPYTGARYSVQDLTTRTYLGVLPIRAGLNLTSPARSTRRMLFMAA